MSRGAAPNLPETWLLTPAERGNPATAVDREHPDGRAWTVGKRVTAHVDGAAYFARLHQLLSQLDAGDWLYLTDWRIDATRQLDGAGSELGPLLVRLAPLGGSGAVAPSGALRAMDPCGAAAILADLRSAPPAAAV